MLGATGVTVALVNGLRATVPVWLDAIRTEREANTHDIPPVAKYMPTGKFLPPLGDMPCIMLEVLRDQPAKDQAEHGPVAGGVAHPWTYQVRARVMAAAGTTNLAEQLVMTYVQAVRQALLSMPGLDAAPHSLKVVPSSVVTEYTELHAVDQDASAYVGSAYVRWNVDTLEVLGLSVPAEDARVLDQLWLKVDHVHPPDGDVTPDFTEPPVFERVNP